MNVKIKRALQLSISALLAVIFLYIAFRNQDIGKVWEEIKRVHIGWVLLLLPISIASHGIRAWRWKYFLTPVKSDVKVKNLFYAVMIGYFFNSILPRVGEIARPYAVKKLENIPLTTAIGTVVVERVIDMISLVLIFLLSLMSHGNQLRKAFPWMESGSIILFAGCILFFVFMVLLTIRTDRTIKLVQKTTNWLPVKITQRIEVLLRTFIDGLLIIHNREKYIAVAILTVALWLFYTFQFYVVFFGFSGTSHLLMPDAMVLMVIASIGIILPMPGGTGTFHLFCSQGLILLFNVPADQALSYATVTHGVGLIFLLIAGAIVLVIANINISETTSVINTN